MDIHHKILLDTIKDIVYFKDAQGRNLAVNKAFEELVGLKEEDIIGKTDDQLFPQDLAKQCSLSDRDVFEKGRALRSEEECVGKDGKRMFFDTVKSPVYDEHRNIIGLVGVSSNITEYRQTLEDLQLFKDIINQTNDAVAIVNPETSRFIYVNDGYCSNLGYTRKEMFNMKVTDIEAILPDDFSWSKHVSEVREKGYMLLEGLNKRKDGTTFPVWVNVKILTIMDNNYMVAVVRDITEWKKMQDEMAMLTKGLEQKVIERTSQIESVNRQLKEEIIEHKKDEKRLALKYSITHILSETNDIKEALTKTLKAICEYNGWGIGEIWFIDKAANTLSLDSMWYNPAWDVKEFETVSREITFQKGIGLPGRVWGTGQPSWITDIIVDKNFLRESIASKLGLHGALAFPIKVSSDVIGVMSFFSRTIEPPDNELIQMFETIGSEIGGFITRKQGEEALSNERELFYRSVENLSDGFAILSSVRDKTGNIIDFRYEYINDAGCELNKRSREEHIGHTILDLLPGHKPAGILEEYISVVETGEPLFKESVMYEDVFGDGQILKRYFDYRAVKLGDGFVVTWRDVTDSNKREEELRNNEAKLKALFELLPMGISVLDSERKIIYNNSALGRILDISSDALLRGDYKRRKYIRSDGTPMPPEEYASVRAVKEQRAIHNVETGVVNEDGSVIWTSVDAVPVSFADWKVIVVTSDITDRKKLEAETLKVKTLESIGTLAGGIAHDFNNILTAILGNIYLSKLYLSKKNIPPDDDVFKRLGDSEDSCLHAKELTSLLITFARGGEPIKEQIEISKLLKETAALMIPSNLPITCEFDIPAHLYPVKADKMQIKQAIKGVVINAVEAMPKGGVIKIMAHNISVSEDDGLPLRDGKYLRVSIEDSGIGIPEENLSKIFDPYFSTKDRGAQKGMGLGLSICYSIIRKHEGLITIDSKAGVGTTVHFYLPTYPES